MSNLVCHKKNTHLMANQSLPYFCGICNKSFAERDHLRIHEQEKHSSDTKGVYSRMSSFNPIVGQISCMAPSSSAGYVPNADTLSTATVTSSHSNHKIEAAASNDGVTHKNCQMIFERTNNHFIFSKLNAIVLPQKIGEKNLTRIRKLYVIFI